MAHVFEPFRTVVCSHARGTDTTEWEILLYVMKRNIIDTNTTTLYARSELHETIGTFFIENNFIVDFKFWIYSMIKQNTKKEIKRASAYSKRQSLCPPILLRDFINRNTSYKSPL